MVVDRNTFAKIGMHAQMSRHTDSTQITDNFDRQN